MVFSCLFLEPQPYQWGMAWFIVRPDMADERSWHPAFYPDVSPGSTVLTDDGGAFG